MGRQYGRTSSWPPWRHYDVYFDRVTSQNMQESRGRSGVRFSKVPKIIRALFRTNFSGFEKCFSKRLIFSRYFRESFRDLWREQ